MKRFLFFTLYILLPSLILAQNTKTSQVITSDIDHFWAAYDKAEKTSDTSIKRQLIQQIYIEKGSQGLHAFMKARDYNAPMWVELFNKYPRFWESVRKNTLRIKTQTAAILKSIDRFKKLYPEMRPAKIYFTIGGLKSGGTISGNMVLVGAEIATADHTTDASELGDWLQGVFKSQEGSNLISLNVHEYVHTQQKEGSNSLLAQSIREGSADFISELVTGKTLNTAYANYGKQHEASLKKLFKIEMFGTDLSKWLYNGSDSKQADLGYFMGYTICKSYYQNHVDKTLAIKNIIELDYRDTAQVHGFLANSKYYKETLHPETLLKELDLLSPYVVNLSPDIAGKTNIDTTLTELTINFSQPMGDGKSISLGASGREHFPLTDAVGFSEDHKSYKVKLSLKSNQDYEFVITGRGFKSKEGYKLKECTVRFKTN